MDEALKKFLEKIGVAANTIKFFETEAEQRPEETTADTLADAYATVQSKIYENKFKKGLFTQEDVDKKFGIYRGSMAQAINKAFELEMTREDAEKIEPKEMIQKAVEAMTTKVEGATKIKDPELINQIKDLQKTNSEINDQLEAAKTQYDTDLEAAKKEYEKNLSTEKVKTLFRQKFEKYVKDWAVDVNQIPVWKERVESDILAAYDVNGEGILKGKNGTHAESFDKTGIYETVDEPIEYLLREKYKVVKESNGNGSGDGGGSGEGEATFARTGVAKNKLSERAKQMLAKAQAQG